MDLKLKLFEYGFALVAGPLAAIAVQLLKRYSFWLDSLSAWQKRAFVLVTVTVFTALGAATGADFGVVAGQENVDFLTTIDTEAIKVALGAGVAFLLHALKPKKKK
ncbi:hypothetical protein [Caudoviricetes sp.]|nr:hypothetical protein [Caudoviricetes sp.]